jgi:hypothetical protein
MVSPHDEQGYTLDDQGRCDGCDKAWHDTGSFQKQPQHQVKACEAEHAKQQTAQDAASPRRALQPVSENGQDGSVKWDGG